MPPSKRRENAPRAVEVIQIIFGACARPNHYAKVGS